MTSTMRITLKEMMVRQKFMRSAHRKFATSRQQPSSVTTTLQYLEPLDRYKNEKPYLINIPSEALSSGSATNESYIPYGNIIINDVRGRENSFTLDQNGFAVFHDGQQYNPSFKSSTVSRDLRRNFLGTVLEYEEYESYQLVKQKYRAATDTFLTHLLGAETTKTFGHEVRRRQHSFPNKPRGEDGTPQPIQGVHIGMLPSFLVRRGLLLDEPGSKHVTGLQSMIR